LIITEGLIITDYAKRGLGLGVMLFNGTFNNISVTSWLSVLLVEETGVPILPFNHDHVMTAPYYDKIVRLS
jgi:hypothetical protein